MENLGAKRIRKFFQQFPSIEYGKKETILRAEDSPQGIYYLSRGYVRMYMLTSEGGELTLNIFRSGNTFPLSWVFERIPNEYFFETMDESRIFRAPVEEFSEFIKEDKEVLIEIARSLAHRLDRVHKRIQYLTMGDSFTKVINIFLMLGRRMGQEDKSGLIISTPITHQDIANLAGITRETVGLEIKKLKKRGLISMKGRLYVLKNLDKLQVKSVINSVVDENLIPVSEKMGPQT